MRKERYIQHGTLALTPQAWGADFMVLDIGAASSPFELVGDKAVVCVDGPLVQHAHPFWDSYDGILARAHAAFEDPKVQSVLLKINSPGGDMLGCIEAAREIRAMGARHKKPIVAHTDGWAASAAFALACSADKIFVTPTAFVGSIGVFEAIVDQSAADAAMGVRFVFAASGERKLDGNPHVPITKGAVANLQSQVDALAGLFFDWVAECRPLSKKDVAALQAGTFFGMQAVGVSLADGVLSYSDVLSKGGIPRESPKGKSAMPKYLEENRDKLAESIAQAIKDGDAEGEKKMRKALKALEDDDSSSPKENEGGDEAAKKAKAEEEEKKAKAAEEEKKAKAEDEEKKAQAALATAKASGDATAVALAAIAETQKLRAEIAERDAAASRQAIFASRPDLPKAVVALLESKPVAEVKAYVDNFPKVAANPHAAAAAATGTRGKTQTSEATEDASDLDPKDQAHIDKMMGLGTPSAGIVHKGNTLELGFMSPKEAMAKAVDMQKKGML